MIFVEKEIVEKYLNGILHKKCPVCKIWKPVDNDNFHKNKGHKFGFKNRCKKCVKVNLNILKLDSLYKNENGVNYKRCSICKNYFLLNNDYFVIKTKTSFSSACKKCLLERNYKNKKENSFDYIINQCFNGIQTRVKKYNLELDFTVDHLYNLYTIQKGKCAISGEQMTTIVNSGRTNTNISVDKINSDKGYIKGNVQLVCVIVNVMKFNNNTTDFISWCKKIINNYENKNN